ncbi:10460_t:CDS:2, partial [Acaulospora colombiana]
IVQELNEMGMSRDILKEMSEAKEGYKLEYSFEDIKEHIRPYIKLDLDDCDHISKAQLSTVTHLAGSSRVSFSKYDSRSVSSLSSTLTSDSEFSITNNDFLFDELPGQSSENTRNEATILMEK